MSEISERQIERIHLRADKTSAKDEVRDRMKRAGLWRSFVVLRTDWKRKNPKQPLSLGWHVAAGAMWGQLTKWEFDNGCLGGPNPLAQLGDKHYAPPPVSRPKDVPEADEEEVIGEIPETDYDRLPPPPDVVEGLDDFDVLKWVLANLAKAIAPKEAPSNTHYSVWTWAKDNTNAFMSAYYNAGKKKDEQRTNFDDDGREQLVSVETLLRNTQVGTKHAQETRKMFSHREDAN